MQTTSLYGRSEQRILAEPREIEIALKPFQVRGWLWPPDERGRLVVVADGTHDALGAAWTQSTASALGEIGLGALAVDLLTGEEGEVEAERGQCALDLTLLAGRLAVVLDWVRGTSQAPGPIGIFATRGAAVPALIAASERPSEVAALAVSASRPDLAGWTLQAVRAPTLLLVPPYGPADAQAANQRAFEVLGGPKFLETVEDSTQMPRRVAAFMAHQMALRLAAGLGA